MTSCRLQFIGCFFCAMMLTSIVRAQCTFDVNADINDLETVNLQIIVDNLVNDDLAGAQAVCAVELRFRHSYLGDLTIELTSPAGQTVQLVGGVTDQINPTSLTTWDVRFLQCGFPASPDPGFTAQWNNNQAWQVFTTYTGSYYPSSGCLEDFNMGSANGIWQLTITDHDAPQTGRLLGVTLIFCDGTGLECNVCGADAGAFTQVPIAICEGMDFAITPLYPDTIPDPLLYGYVFLLTPDSMNKILTDQVSVSTLPPSMYTICGISYSYEDSSALFTRLDTMTFVEIQSAFANNEISECADITESCLSLEISPFIDTTFLNQQICAGSSVTVGGQVFSTSGTHIVSIDVPGSCDSIVVLELNVIFVEARVSQVDTISCENGITILDGSTSVAGPGASYAWSTSTGSILSAADQPTITIDGKGVYTLTVTYQGCSDEMHYDVIGDSSIPFLFVGGGTLDCNNPTFTFNPVTFPIDVVYVWSGPNGFSSIEAKPTTTAPGVYTLTITGPSGCSVSTTTEVLIDTSIFPQLDLVLVECAFQRATLRAQQGFTGYTFLWTLPGGMTTTDQEIYATTSGEYCVEVTGANGCSASACIDFVADFTYPDIDIMATDDSLHCNMQVTLTASSATDGVIFQWRGPGGILSGNAVQDVLSPGQYIVSASAPNQCVSFDTINIYVGSDLLDFGTFTDTLDCTKDTALIGVLLFEAGVSYSWSGPGLVDTHLAFVRVVSPGTYNVRIEAPSGCVQFSTIAVFGDYQTVYFTTLSDTITCDDQIANLSFISYNDFDVIDWVSPDGSHSTDSILNTNLNGTYQLTLIGKNGCPRTLDIPVPIDTIGPTVFFDSQSLACKDSVQILTISIDSIQMYQWNGPSGFSSNITNPYVYASGNYLVEATGFNGCRSNYIHFVESNLSFPSLSLSAEELDCIDSSALLTIMSPDTALDYAWYLSNIRISDTTTVNVSAPGQYIGSVTASNGCTTVDTIEVLPPLLPMIFVQTDTITCVSVAMLMASSDLPGVIFSWEDAGGMTDTGSQYSTMLPGAVLLRATGTNGCSTDTTVVVEADTLAPVAIASNNEMVLCNVQTIHLDASGSIGQISDFLWTTSNGIIDSGAGTASPVITGEGTYIVMVTDASNGCTDSDTIVITEGQSMLGTIYLTTIAECEGNGNGSISIDSVPGAASALMYSINDEPGGPLFDQLTSGSYHIVVIDSFGCSADTIVNISNTSSTHSISLGEDKSILVGDSVLIEIAFDLDPSEILSVQWVHPVSCDSCLANYVGPIETSVYEVLLTDIFGCITSDQVTVFVEEKPRFFIPNVFSPNGDNINDYLAISAHPGIDRILEFTIYDRWGNAVYHRTDFDRSDISVAWDGTLNGKALNPAVFVYILTVKLLTGREETNHGTITIVK